MKNKIIIRIIGLLSTLLICTSCGIYSFSGTSIQPDVKTVTINYFEYKALTVNPNLSSLLTEKMKEKFKNLTRLSEVELDGDLEIEGSITNYTVTSIAVTANEVAAQNRLTVSVNIKFTNRKYPEENFTRSFSAYSDYDSSNNLDAVESSLTEEIVEKLCEDIFNASVANW